MRKVYLDNIRWSIILLVLIHHVVCIFSSCGAAMSYNTSGILALDTVGYLIYPWFMPCLFVVGGICARYSLQNRSGKDFAKERFWRLLVPFFSYVFLIGPFAANLSFQVNHMEKVLSKVPAPVIFLIRIVSGMGPAWFLLQMFLVSLVLLLIRVLDKKDVLLKAGSRCNIPLLLLLYFPVWGSAQILNVYFTFRNALYLLLFLLGYYLFSHEKIQMQLQKHSVSLLIVGIGAGIVQTFLSWGIAYEKAVNSWSAMLYTWLMILAVLGCAGRWFNREGHFSLYINKRSFGIYYFHYVPMVYAAYFLTTQTSLPVGCRYVLVLLISFIASIGLYEVISRIPLLKILFGLRRQKNLARKA